MLAIFSLAHIQLIVSVFNTGRKRSLKLLQARHDMCKYAIGDHVAPAKVVPGAEGWRPVAFTLLFVTPETVRIPNE